MSEVSKKSPHLSQSARVRTWAKSNHSQSLMAGNFAALLHTDPKFSAIKEPILYTTQDPTSQSNSQDRRGTQSPRKYPNNQSPHSPQNSRNSPDNGKTKEPKLQRNE